MKAKRFEIAVAAIVAVAMLATCSANSLLTDVQAKVVNAKGGGTVIAPIFSPAPSSTGTYTSSSDLSVAITCPTSRATIHYTTDGSTPSVSTTAYDGPLSVAGDGTTKTIKAIAIKAGMTDSPLVAATYTIAYSQVSAPQFNLAGGTYGSDQIVTITCATPGATIYYTTDRTTPTTLSTKYTGAISVAGNGTVKAIKAIAAEAQMKISPVAWATYAISTTPSATHVYISGEVGPSSGNTVPVYWKDGTLNALQLSAGFTNGWVGRIAEDSSGNIYIVGGQHKAGTTIYGYWENSTFTTISKGGYSVVWNYAIAVDTSGNVWVGGMVGNSSPPPTTVYWSGGAGPTPLANAGSGGLGNLRADASGNVFFTQAEGDSASNYVPYFWKNGATPTALPLLSGYPNGYAQDFAFDTSGNCYITGSEWSYGITPAVPLYWETVGGTWEAPILLPKGAFSGNDIWNVRGVAVDNLGNLDFYACIGPSSSATALVYWKGASFNPSELYLNNAAYFDSGSDGLCAADTMGNFFIVQSLGSSSTTTAPVYWENGGNPVPLPMGTGNSFGQANGIVIGP